MKKKGDITAHRIIKDFSNKKLSRNTQISPEKFCPIYREAAQASTVYNFKSKKKMKHHLIKDPTRGARYGT